MRHSNRDTYDPAFKAVRPSIIERDGGHCVKCGSDARIEVHHVNGYMDNDPANLQTLCYFCHGIAPMGDEYWAWKQSGEDGWSHFFRTMRILRPTLTDDWLRDAVTEIFQYQKVMGVASAFNARRRIRQSGIRCEGRKPYGMKDGEAQWLEHMRRLRTDGVTFDRIANSLNQAGAVTRYGKRWIGATVCQILDRDKKQTASSRNHL